MTNTTKLDESKEKINKLRESQQELLQDDEDAFAEVVPTLSVKQIEEMSGEELLAFNNYEEGKYYIGEPDFETQEDMILKAYKEFLKRPLPSFGPDLSEIDFDDFTYFIKPSDKVSNNWEEVPIEIKNTFDKIFSVDNSVTITPFSIEVVENTLTNNDVVS